MEKTENIFSSESPFMSLTSFKEGEAQDSGIATFRQSPFVQHYEGGDDETADDEVAFFVSELYDQEFEDATQDLIFETRLTFEHALDTLHENSNYEHVVEGNVEQYFLPLDNEVEQLFNRLLPLAEAYEQGQINSEDLAKSMDEIRVQNELSPQFENFLGKLWKKAKKAVKKVAKKVKSVAKKGIALARKFGLGFVINRIKRIAKSFLKSIIKRVLGRIPLKYRGLAKKLANKLGVRSEIAMTPQEEGEMQLDLALAELAFVENEYEADTINYEFERMVHDMSASAEEQMNRLREKFVENLSEVETEEEAGPVIEEFVGAALSILRWGIKIAGRERVKKLLVSILTSLVGRYIGKKYAKALTSKIVNYGFKALNLEVESNDMAAEAVAGVVEDTLLAMEELEDYQLDNAEVFQAEVISAFEAAAAKGLPDVLPENEYENNPELRESFLHPTMWKLKNIGKNKRKYRYRKNGRVYDVKLSPKDLHRLRSFGGKKLSNILAAKLGIRKAQEVPARIHLFELLPGATIHDIAVNEFDLNESERGTEDLLARIHPLTTRSAGILLRDPGLDCKKICSCLKRNSAFRPHRVFYLEIPGARLQKYQSGSKVLSRSESQVKLYRKSDGTTLHFFFSEPEAQRGLQLIKNSNRGEVIKFLTDHSMQLLSNVQKVGAINLNLQAIKSRLGRLFLENLIDLRELEDAINDPKDGISIVVMGPKDLDKDDQWLRASIRILSGSELGE